MRSVWIIAWALLCGPASAARGQQGTGAPASQDTAETTPEALPATEIPRRASEALARLAVMRTRLTLDSSVLAIEAALPQLLATIPETPSDSALSQLTLLSIEPLLDTLTLRLNELTEWQDRLEARSARIAGVTDSLRTLRTLWRVTLDTAVSRDAPEAVRQRAQTVLATVDSVARQAATAQSVVLTELDQVSETGTAVREAVTQIAAAAAAARSRLLEPDSPPLWKARGVGVATLAAQLGTNWRIRAGTLRGFIAENWARAGVQILLFLFLVTTIIRLRRYMPTDGTEDPSLRAPIHLLSHPIASAALLALLVSRLVYPTIPTTVISLLVLVGLVVVLWLIHGLVERQVRAPLYVLAVLLLFVRERLLVEQDTLLYRVLLLLTTGGGLAALGWFLSVRRHTAREQSGLQAAVQVGARIGAVILAIALLANVAGLVTLADLLDGGVIWSAALGLILATGVFITRGALALALRSRLARRFRVVQLHEAAILTSAGSVVRIVAIVWWVTIVLRAFVAYEPMYAAVAEFLSRSRSLGSMSFRIGDWALFAVTIWAAVWASRVVRLLLDEDVLPRLALRRGVAGLVSALARYAILGLGLTIALAAAGIELDRLALVAGALGLGIGFGLQNIVSNFVAGLVLLFERPIQSGDTVEVGTLFGEVRRIGVRSSTVRTFDGADVIVPNSNLITNEVVNWTLSDKLRRAEVKVGVAYGNDPERVREILMEVGRAHPDVLDNPPPMVLFVGFGESSLDFSLRCWTGEFSRFLAIRSDLASGIYAALRKAGIEIPFPQRDLHLRSVAPGAQTALHAPAPEAPS